MSRQFPIIWSVVVRGASQVASHTWLWPSLHRLGDRQSEWIDSIEFRLQSARRMDEMTAAQLPRMNPAEHVFGASQDRAAVRAEFRDRFLGQLAYSTVVVSCLLASLYGAFHWSSWVAFPMACMPLLITWGVLFVHAQQEQAQEKIRSDPAPA